MTKWVLSLNQVTPELAAKLPQTDTRFRPDLQFLERGVNARVSTLRQLKSGALGMCSIAAVTPMYVQGLCIVSGDVLAQWQARDLRWT